MTMTTAEDDDVHDNVQSVNAAIDSLVQKGVATRVISFNLTEMGDAMLIAFANALADDIDAMAFDHTMPEEWHATRASQLKAMCDELTRRGLEFDALVRCPGA